VKLADIISGIISGLIGVYVLITCSYYPEDLIMKIGPAFFPEILAWGLVVFSVLLILQAIAGKSLGEFEKLSIKRQGNAKNYCCCFGYGYLLHHIKTDRLSHRNDSLYHVLYVYPWKS